MLTQYHKPRKVRRIPAHVDPKQLEQDLDSLRKLALEMGASEVSVLQGSDLLFSESLRKRVQTDHSYPSIHWPLEYPKDDLELGIRAFQRGLFFCTRASPGMPDYGGGPVADPAHREAILRVYEICALLESESFYMGYPLAIGLAMGNCRAIFCPDERSCWASVKGRKCVQPYKGRPSMEAAGIDAPAMARALKWKAPGKKADPLLAGLVMVV